jgi:hypothetical protein
MAFHHIAAIILFSGLSYRMHLGVWQAFRPIHLIPFLIHAAYWALLPYVDSALGEGLLALYNVSLVLAAVHTFRMKHRFHSNRSRTPTDSLRPLAVVAILVAAINFWTYCWEMSGAWCFNIHGRFDSDRARNDPLASTNFLMIKLHHVPQVIYHWVSTGQWAIRNEGGAGASRGHMDPMTRMTIEADWMSGLFNAWYAGIIAILILGIADLR